VAGKLSGGITRMAGATISVVIPTFNRAPLVRQAVQSVFAQTFADYEVVVVDDGSTDNTKEMLASFLETPNFHYHYQSNSGRSTARNHGIKLAQGEFLMFLDSDDMLLPEALAKLYEAAQRTTAGMIHGEAQFIDEHGRRLWTSKPTTKALRNGLTYHTLIREPYFMLQGAFLLRASCLQRVGEFDRTLEPSEDYDFSMRAVLECQLTYIAVPVLRCRVHGGNTDPTEIYKCALKVAHKHLRILDETKAKPDALTRLTRANWMLRLADIHYALSQNREALKHYLFGLKLHPTFILDSNIAKQILSSLVPTSIRKRLKSTLLSARRMSGQGESNGIS
jgi:glycosyltransferase involved in cell wall biosynthesis